jgi:hypothetical protein
MTDIDRSRLDILATEALEAVMTADGRVDRLDQRALLTELIDTELEGRTVEETRELAAYQLAAQTITRQRRRQSYRVDHSAQLILWDSYSMFRLGENLDVKVENATRDDIELVKKVKGEAFDSFEEKWTVESRLLADAQARYESPSQTWSDLDLDGVAAFRSDPEPEEGWDPDDPRWDT